MSFVQRIGRWLRRWFCRCDIAPTGLRGAILAQGRCTRCGALFLVNMETGGLLPWTRRCDEAAREFGWGETPRELPRASVVQR